MADKTNVKVEMKMKMKKLSIFYFLSAHMITGMEGNNPKCVKSDRCFREDDFLVSE